MEQKKLKFVISIWVVVITVIGIIATCPILSYSETDMASLNGKSLSAYRISEKIELDGQLNEVDWQRAEAVEDFVQTEPQEGAPATEVTRLRVAYNSDKIYFGFECFDSEPSRIAANEMRRDGRLHRNDNVYVLIDTYNDRRSGFFFRVNPLSAMEDSAITDGGEKVNENWDAVWECKSAIHNWGWSSEIAIPFNQLRFKRSDEMVWGVNFGRSIQRKKEESTWALVPRSYGYMGRYRTSNLGQLVGLKGIPPSYHLEFLPYMLPGATVVRQSASETESVLKAGLDLKYGITPNLTSDLTFNTDFAQVEADEEEVNLTRFSLFFPEKRPFFLEGAGLFDFGSPRSGFRRPPPMLLFYSRRIGLSEGEAVPILIGSKISGKVGKYGVGLLNVLTDEKAELDLPKANFSALRLQRDVLSRSSVGLILLNQQMGTQSGYDRGAGLDFNLLPRENLSFRGMIAKTAPSADIGEGDSSYYLGGEWRNQLFRAEASYLDIGEDFDPKMGFVWRKGIRTINSSFRFIPLPHKYGVRRIYLGPEFNYVLDHNGDLQTQTFEFSSWVEREKGGWISLRSERNFERLEEDFEIRPGVIIPKGVHAYNSYRVSISTDEGRMISGDIGSEAGGFFNGNRKGFRAEAQIKPNGQLSWRWRYNYNQIRLPGRSFSTNTLASRLSYSFSTILYAKIFSQWNDAKDQISANFLLNYIYKPGSNFYLVFNQQWDSSEPKIQALESTLLAKFTYLWSL